MSRAQFDSDTVVENAMRLFWAQGYSAASMQQVAASTGLKPGSIYLAFGSKDGLYEASIERYAKQSLSMINAKIEQAGSVGEGICAFLLDIIEVSDTKCFHSCFLVRTRLELPQDSALHILAGERMRDVEHCFSEHLEKEFGREQAEAYAAVLMLHIFGVRVYGYHSESKSTTRNALQFSLPWLPWKNSTN